MRKVYLGDGVYMTIDEHNNVILTTENGLQETNRIVLEPEVLTQFLYALEHVGAASKQG